jgi:hypothetical protein
MAGDKSNVGNIAAGVAPSAPPVFQPNFNSATNGGNPYAGVTTDYAAQVASAYVPTLTAPLNPVQVAAINNQLPSGIATSSAVQNLSSQQQQLTNAKTLAEVKVETPVFVAGIPPIRAPIPPAVVQNPPYNIGDGVPIKGEAPPITVNPPIAPTPPPSPTPVFPVIGAVTPVEPPPPSPTPVFPVIGAVTPVEPPPPSPTPVFPVIGAVTPVEPPPYSPPTPVVTLTPTPPSVPTTPPDPGNQWIFDSTIADGTWIQRPLPTPVVTLTPTPGINFVAPVESPLGKWWMEQHPELARPTPSGLSGGYWTTLTTGTAAYKVGDLFYDASGKQITQMVQLPEATPQATPTSILSFKKGGVVQGKKGKEVIIKVHAGELIIPAKTTKELRKLLNKKEKILRKPKTKVTVRKVKKNRKDKWLMVRDGRGSTRRYIKGKEQD